MRRVVCSLGIGLAIAVVGLAGGLLAPVRPASAAPLPQATQPHDGSADPTLPPPAATATPGNSVVNQITNLTRNIIQFQYDTMATAVTRMAADMSRKAYASAAGVFSEALSVMVFGDFGIVPRAGGELALFSDLVKPHWQVTFTLALLLLPATLVLTAVSTLRQGATSVLTYADLKEALLGWFIAVAAAAASYYLLSLVFRLSVSGAALVGQADLGSGPLDGAHLANTLFNINVIGLLMHGTATDYLLVTLVGFFVLFLACSIVLGLGLALAAFTALAYLLTVIAPLILVLGTLRPLQWLKDLWLKGVILVALLPLVNVLLLKAAETIAFRMLAGQGVSQFGSVLGSICISAGVLSTLIAINFKVAEMVFGALGDVLRQAGDSLSGMAGLVTGAVTLAVGVATMGVGMPALGLAAGAGGLVGGGGSAASSPGGGLGPAVPPLPTAGGGGNGGGSAAAAGQGAASQAQVTPDEVTRQLSSLTPRESAAAAPAAEGQPGDNLPARPQAGDASREAGSAAASSPSRAEGAEASNSRDAASQQNPAALRLPPYPKEAAAQSRQAHLAGSFGAMLSRSRNPLIQGAGMGLQAAGALAGAQAGMVLDQQHAAREEMMESRYQLGQQARTEQQAGWSQREELRQQERTTGQTATQQRNAVYWAERFRQRPDMGTPVEVMTPRHPIDDVLSGVILGGLQQRGFTAPLEGAIQPLVAQSYGYWRDHYEANSGQDGVRGNTGVQVRREMFNVMAEPENVLNPARLEGELQAIAGCYGFELGPDLHQVVEKMPGSFQSLT